ncbi:MAG: hypothetical protein UDO63_09850 [Oscillospiraceae bacterium]|jgi:hypothetical protein
MTNEQIKEIIKSFNFGMSAEQIAEVEEVPVEEIKQIQVDYADDIQKQIAWNKQKYGDDM